MPASTAVPTLRPRTVVLAVAAALAAAALPAPALASPGDVGVSAQSRFDAETFARASDLRKSRFERDEDRDTDGDGRASSSYNWPLSGGPPPPTAFICDADGCIGFDGAAHGAVDEAAGTMSAYASGRMYIGNTPSDNYGLAGYVFSDGSSRLDDTITLSEPATVVLTGRIAGNMDGYRSHPDHNPNVDASVDVNLRFSRDRRPDEYEHYEELPWVDLGGYSNEFYPTIDKGCGEGTCGSTEPLPDTGESVDEPFSVEVDLPAGTSYFNANLAASTDFQVYGYQALEKILSSSGKLDFANTLEFSIAVPEGVQATSGSGLLPIEGGEAQDETPPELTVPDTITVPATSAAGAAVTYSATATDDQDDSPDVACEPASGATFPIGTTTVSCTATDAAGNEDEGTFLVVVEGAGAQLDGLQASVAAMTLANGTATQLGHRLDQADRRLGRGETAKACSELDKFLRVVANERRHGRLNAAQASSLSTAAQRIAAVVGC